MPKIKNEATEAHQEENTLQDIKQINKRLEEIKIKIDAKRQPIIEAIERNKAIITENEAILKEPKTAAEYRKATETISAAKKELEFYKIQLSKFDNKISKEDYNAALKELNDSLNAYVFINRETLKNEIETVIKDYFDYYDGFNEYNTALINLAELAGVDDDRRFPDSELYKDETISGLTKRFFEYLHSEKGRVDYLELLAFQNGLKK